MKKLTAAAFFLGVALALYPALAETVLRQAQLREAAGASAAGETADESLKEAVAYNEALFKIRQTEAFHYKGAEATDPVYEAQLPGTMAVLEIPSIGLIVPVGHGTSNKTLQKEAGHFYGTSLPVGGPSTHAGIAGHTGLAGAKLFSDLDRVGEGDVFYIHVLNRHNRYRVTAVRVVEPAEADRFLQIEEGRDLITLYTCTPYGINTHRLLVTGERDEEEAAGSEEADLKASLKDARLNLLRLALSVTLMAFAVSALMSRALRGPGCERPVKRKDMYERSDKTTNEAPRRICSAGGPGSGSYAGLRADGRGGFSRKRRRRGRGGAGGD